MQDWSDDEIATLRRLHKQGVSMPKIADQLPNKSYHQVQKLITRHRHDLGLEYRHYPTQPEEHQGSFSCERCKELITKSWKS